MNYIDVLRESEDMVTPGMSACQGCGGELILRTVLQVAGKNTIIGIPPGCMAGAGVCAAAAGGDLENAAVDPQYGFRLNAVCSCDDLEIPACNVNKAPAGILRVAGLDAVCSRVQDKCAVCNFYAVFSIQPASCRSNVIGAAGEDEIVLGNHRVLVFSVYRQLSRTVEGEVCAAEDHAVHVAVFLGKIVDRAAGKRIFRAFRKSDENLICRADEQRRVVLAENGRAVQNELDLFAVRYVDNDPAVLKRPGYQIGPFLGNGDDAVRIGSAASA